MKKVLCKICSEYVGFRRHNNHLVHEIGFTCSKCVQDDKEIKQKYFDFFTKEKKHSFSEWIKENPDVKIINIICNEHLKIYYVFYI